MEFTVVIYKYISHLLFPPALVWNSLRLTEKLFISFRKSVNLYILQRFSYS